MKLLSTIRYSSGNPGNPAGSNHGGNLRLFFTTLNQVDFLPNPPPIMWQVGAGTAATDTYTLPTGDVIALNLNVIADIPGRLYVFGDIQVTTAAGVFFGAAPLGQAPPTLFVPGQPAVAILMGRLQGQANGVGFDVGFELAVPWDGTSADCSGSWWAVWH